MAMVLVLILNREYCFESLLKYPSADGICVWLNDLQLQVSKTEDLSEEDWVTLFEGVKTPVNVKTIAINTKKTAEENISMYDDLEKDMAQLYKQGYTSETDYLSAKNNLNSSIIKKISNLIDLIIYNDDVISNFVSED